MKRGEVPDFSANQKLGIRSLGAHEQDARRDYQIDGLARRLDIPRTRLRENRTVQRYVSVIRDAEAASERLGTYSTKAFMRETDPVAHERTGQASLLYVVEKRMLKEGFRGRTVSIDPETAHSITTDLDRVVQPYGLSVDVPAGWEEERDWEVRTGVELPLPKPAPLRGVWQGPLESGPFDPWQRVDGNDRFWELPDWPNERHDREHMRALAAEAAVQGVDPDRPCSDPVMHTLLTGVLYGRELVRATEDLQGLPPAPGMTPPAQERLRRVAPLNRLAVGVLEDAVRPGSMTQERVIVELTPILATYDLRFVA